MLKKYSTFRVFRGLCEVVYRKGFVKPSGLGRPCEVPKHKLVSFLLLWKVYDEVLEKMELDSEIYLGRHYDHSSFSYHYKRLSEDLIYKITSEYAKLCIQLLEQDILFHIYDSTAISTSVREERIRQGTRNKEKITQKFHTTLGYDPPNKLVIVEAMLASDHHISDAQGAIKMMDKNWRGYDLGDRAYETYGVIKKTKKQKRIPIYKPKKRNCQKKDKQQSKTTKDMEKQQFRKNIQRNQRNRRSIIRSSNKSRTKTKKKLRDYIYP